VDGFIVQLPLPGAHSVEKITRKDQGRTGGMSMFLPTITSEASFQKIHWLLPATPFGIMELLRRYDIKYRRKELRHRGASRIAGSGRSA